MEKPVTVIVVEGGAVTQILSTDSSMVFYILDHDAKEAGGRWVGVLEWPETQYDEDEVKEELGFDPAEELEDDENFEEEEE